MSRDSIERLSASSSCATAWIAVEELLFETLGGWARRAADPAVKRLFGDVVPPSRLARRLWRERLPAIDASTATTTTSTAGSPPLRAATG